MKRDDDLAKYLYEKLEVITNDLLSAQAKLNDLLNENKGNEDLLQQLSEKVTILHEEQQKKLEEIHALAQKLKS